MNKEEKAYIRSMNWKEKLKWKLLIILIALIGILIVWCAGKAGERKAVTEKEILRAVSYTHLTLPTTSRV